MNKKISVSLKSFRNDLIDGITGKLCAMESSRDSIKYVKPVFDRSFSKKSLANKHTDYTGNDNEDLWGYKKGEKVRNTNNAFEKDYRKALYETTEDRMTQELLTSMPGIIDDESNPTKITITYSNLGGAGSNYPARVLEGYGVVYGDKDKETIGFADSAEQDIVAVEEKTTKQWFIGTAYQKVVDKVEGKKSDDDTTYTITVTLNNDASDADLASLGIKKTGGKNFKAMVRFDLEDDFEGDHLGEVTLTMTDYEFKPRPTSIGVNWSQLSEIVLDTSFGVSAQETLVDYAAQAIRVSLDYRAIKLAYGVAKTNPEGYTVVFNAGFLGSNVAGGGAAPTGIMQSYIHNAATFSSAVETVGDVMLNDIEVCVAA